MNTTDLIEAVVRQTMVLIASLATATGGRAPLARIANQVFTNLVSELKAQGVGNKVIADMFGVAMRTYHYRVARLAESETDHGHSVWEAVLAYCQAQGTVLRADVLRRFDRDDAETVRSVLRDLVDSRLLYRTGRGDATAYRVAGDAHFEDAERSATAQHLIRVALHRDGPLSLAQLVERVSLPSQVASALLAQLVAGGGVVCEERDGEPHYRIDTLVIDYDDAGGWQAALFDHYQAMVSAMCTKLQRGATRAQADDRVGGSTYHFDLWPGHPLAGEVDGLLAELRARVRELCERVMDFNAEHAPDQSPQGRRVIAYVGQTVISEEGELDDGEA